MKSAAIRAWRACAIACGACIGCAACGEHRAPPRPPLREVCAPVPACPSWVDAFKENRATLHVYLFDGVSMTPACARGQTLRVTVYLDGEAAGVAEVPCLDELRAPPPSYRVEGAPVAPGLHELRVDVQTPRGIVQGTTLLSLPAFDIPSDGRSVAIGAEIAVGLGPDDLAIGPPQVYPPKSL